MFGKIWLVAFLFSFLPVLFALPVYGALEVISYPITEGLQVDTSKSTQNGQTFFTKNITINYESGRVLLSGSANGHDSLHVEDMIQVSKSQGATFTYATFDRLCKTFNREIPPQDITHLLSLGSNNLNIKFSDWCASSIDTIGPVYIVYEKTPTPFLDLPWDYESKGLSFNQAALSMYSYFDHTYPLLSSGLPEPTNFLNQITSYGNKDLQKPYSSHDGYDYARNAQVLLDDPVLSAASGTATFVNTCIPCGNMIVIDHGNGYQTRYLHLLTDSLISKIPGEKIFVPARKQIGKVGSTGNSTGAHIHFGLIEDKNKDGNFEDNIPDGITDPFGWAPITNPDPWANYEFFYGGKNRNGNASSYLWKKLLAGLTQTSITINPGKTYTIDSCVFKFQEYLPNVNLRMQAMPASPPHSSLTTAGPAYEIELTRYNGEKITQFSTPSTITLNFSSLDLSKVRTETISLYSSPDGVVWVKEPTTVDLANKKASAIVNHLSQFVVMAERVDSTPPVTIAEVSGKPEDIFTLHSTDNDGGLGVDYTLYREEGSDWKLYTSPVTFMQNGHYNIEYYSVDNDDNKENIKKVEFDIQKDDSPPEAVIGFDLMSPAISIEGQDSEGEISKKEEQIAKDTKKIILTDSSNNTLTLNIFDKENSKTASISIHSLTYNNNVPLSLHENKLSVKYHMEESKEEFKQLEQIYEVKGELKVKLLYRLKTDKTQVIIKEAGKEKIKEELPGVKLLYLYTDKGSVKFQY